MVLRFCRKGLWKLAQSTEKPECSHFHPPLKMIVRPTLRQVFGFSLLGLLTGLGLLFYLVLNGSEKTILQSSERYRDLASREVAYRVTNYLDEAPMAVAHFEQQVKYGLLDPAKTDSGGQGLR